MEDRHVAVIGAGAAGLVAAYALKDRVAKVTIIERNSLPARKVRITGKGRCNITNIADTEEFMDNITRNKRFMYSAFSKFSNYDVMALMEDMGVATKVERGGRVFPASDSAKDVADALVKAASGDNVKFVTERAIEIELFNGQVTAVKTDKGRIECDSVILATGGKSYPLTGSDGSGYRFAKKLGHTIIQPKPSLIPLVTKEKWVSELMGLSLKNIAFSVFSDGKKVYSDFGEMLFTHFGISGPVVLSASAHLEDVGEKEYYAEIDLKPALDEKQLDSRILRDFEGAGKKHLINALDKLLPKALIPVIIELSDVPAHTEVTSVTREQRLRLGQTIKKLGLKITGTRPIEEAIVTKGGISCSEINPSTMESKIVKGLYFAGEVIDVDAYTGGFNLQIAFSTGYLAGINA
ncbi:MAG: NAD(P)/FAD-dependent oxidoreductase [Eubacteriales bacterium]|nr:NAD(P)/FAD-dependent oxidoreductase [Eubacteriales bacterium]